MSSDRVRGLFFDILFNAERVIGYTRGLNLESFEQDARTYDAVERCIERISEAANRLGPEAEELLPGQPWSDIRGIGNWLRHAYHRVDVVVIWRTASISVPELAAAARDALEKLGA